MVSVVLASFGEAKNGAEAGDEADAAAAPLLSADDERGGRDTARTAGGMALPGARFLDEMAPCADGMNCCCCCAGAVLCAGVNMPLGCTKNDN